MHNDGSDLQQRDMDSDSMTDGVLAITVGAGGRFHRAGRRADSPRRARRGSPQRAGTRVLAAATLGLAAATVALAGVAVLTLAPTATSGVAKSGARGEGRGRELTRQRHADRTAALIMHRRGDRRPLRDRITGRRGDKVPIGRFRRRGHAVVGQP